MVVGKVAVHLTVEFDNVTSQLFENRASYNPCSSVSSIHDYLQFFFESDIFLNIIFVFRNNIVSSPGGTFLFYEIIVLNDGEYVLDGFSVECFLSNHYFEAVIFRRIVGAGEHHSRLHFFVINSEIKERSRNDAELYDLTSC